MAGLVDLQEWLPLKWDDNEPVWRHPRSGYYIAEVNTQGDFQREGKLLAHCLGTKKADDWNELHKMYSIRGPEGVPHATLLTTRSPQVSPYGRCRDLGTGYPMSINGENLWILQVRGREDRLAYIDFHRIAREFYIAHGGKLRTNNKSLDGWCEADGDTDLKYHFAYLYDPEPFKKFDFTWEDVEAYEKAKREGLVH